MHHTETPSARRKATTSRKTHIYALAGSTVALLAILVACSSDSSPTEARPTPSAVRASVTGLAAAAVGQDGQIQLAAPPVGQERELTAAEALAFATAWTHDFAPITRPWLEKTHGAPINFKTLQGCGRALYARSAFNAPSQDIPAPYRRIHGPWWLVTFCDGLGSPSVSVAVSAWATDLTLQAGKLSFPRISGTEFVAVGVPLGHVGEYPMAPEVAVEVGAQQTGKRISSVPELITPLPGDGPPQLARWHLTLEAPSSVRSSSGVRAVDEVFVSPTHIGDREVATAAAAPDQPTTIDLHWTPVPTVGETHAAYAARAINQTTKMVRRVDTPVRVEPISAQGN